MEAILEHGGFDVVAFLAFIERNCINLSPNLYSVHLLFGEIPICLLPVGIHQVNLPFVWRDGGSGLDFIFLRKISPA